MKKFTTSSITVVLGALIVASTWSCGGNSEQKIVGSGATGNSSGSSGEGGETASSGGASASGGTGGGGTNSGGTSTAGASGSPSGGSGGTSTGEVATLGDPCSTPGALACAGNHQKLTLLCNADETWEANETCGAGQFCDSTPGPNVGSCRDAVETCEAPGATFCDGDELRECGPDTVTSELVEECMAGCEDAACLPGPGAGDDPCPETPALADCSTQCGSDHPDCAGALCSPESEPIDLTGIALEAGTILARTPPASSASSCGCESLDPPEEAHFGYFVRYTTQKAQYTLKVTAAAPWHVAVAGPFFACTPDPTFSNCAEVGSLQSDQSEEVLYLWTTDPDAGSVNIEITEGECDFGL